MAPRILTENLSDPFVWGRMGGSSGEEKEKRDLKRKSVLFSYVTWILLGDRMAS